jgi:hypothetical protein
MRSILLAFLFSLFASTAFASPRCTTMDVPVAVDGHPAAFVWAQLCLPANGGVPPTVLLTVHGTGYDHHYWDPPARRGYHSFVRDAARAGFATLNIDRYAIGQSYTPHSDTVSLAVVEDTLVQLLRGLRSGAIGGHAFENVVYVGNSLTSAYGWGIAGTVGRDDIDLLVLTGLTHMTKGSFLGNVQTSTAPANRDPRWASLGLDDNYIATTPYGTSEPLIGWRDELFYYVPGARQRTIMADDMLASSFVSYRLVGESIPLVWSPMTGRAPVEGDRALGVEVPTLMVLGEHDNTTCDGPDGIVCTQENVENLEAPYWQPGVLDVRVIPNTGHSLPWHESGPYSTALILDWIEDHLSLGCGF